MKCVICGRETAPDAMRLGVCWDCAEAESIINEQGGPEQLREKGLEFDSVFKLSDLLDVYLEKSLMSGEQYLTVMEYLKQ